MSACCGECERPQGHEPCVGGLLPYCMQCGLMYDPGRVCPRPDCPHRPLGLQINSNTPAPGESPYEHARRIARPTVIGR